MLLEEFKGCSTKQIIANLKQSLSVAFSFTFLRLSRVVFVASKILGSDADIV